MVNANDIANLITTVGFPIVAYLLIYWDMRRKLEDGFKDLKEAITELTQEVREYNRISTSRHDL